MEIADEGVDAGQRFKLFGADPSPFGCLRKNVIDHLLVTEDGRRPLLPLAVDGTDGFNRVHFFLIRRETFALAPHRRFRLLTGKEFLPEMFILWLLLDLDLDDLLLLPQTEVIRIDDLDFDARDPGAGKYRFDFTQGPDIRRFG